MSAVEQRDVTAAFVEEVQRIAFAAGFKAGNLTDEILDDAQSVERARERFEQWKEATR